MLWLNSDDDYFFFFNDTATTEIYTLSLHDALPISPGEGPSEDREGAAHEGGRDEQDGAGEGEAERHARRTIERERRRGADIDTVGEGQHEGGREPKQTDRDFEPAIECRGPLVAVGPAAEQPGAEAQAAHVGGHHRRHRLDGGAERLIEDPDPEKLVYEPRRAGQKEEKTVGAGRARTHAGRAWPARDPPLGAG